MRELAIPILVALAAGIAVGLQNPLSAMIGQRVGLLQSAFIVHLGGTVVAAALMIVVPGGRLAAWTTVPPYALGAGALGVVAISGISHAIPRIGVAPTVGFLLTAQLTIGALLDHQGWLGAAVRALDSGRIAGLVLLLVGVWLVLR